ncbi:MAG: hypothetical protein ACRC6V_06855 [Bacteroidales bacterium]
MTTIIYDAKNKQMLGDGRISQGTQVTKDDFVKVHNINGILVGAAGVVTHMLKFFEYFEQNTTAEIFQQETMGLVNIVFPETPNEDQFEALVAYPSGELFLFEGNSSILLGQDVSFAIGSGGPYALGALESGAAGDEAMRVATKFDAMSGGEITVVQLEEEPEPLTREVAENLSKDELINMMFGEEEVGSVVDNKGIFTNGDNDYDDNLIHIYSWTDTVVLWQEKDTQEYLFEIDGIEYSVGAYTFTEYNKADMDVDEVRSICDDMQITCSKSNTQQQLIQKIFKEVKSKIPHQ